MWYDYNPDRVLWRDPDLDDGVGGGSGDGVRRGVRRQDDCGQEGDGRGAEEGPLPQRGTKMLRKTLTHFVGDDISNGMIDRSRLTRVVRI